MSLYRDIVDVVERGPIRTDRLAEQFPGYTLSQVGDAAKNAAHRGLIHCSRLERVDGRASLGIWVHGPKPDAPQRVEPPRGDYGLPKVASVWELGAAA